MMSSPGLPQPEVSNRRDRERGIGELRHRPPTCRGWLNTRQRGPERTAVWRKRIHRQPFRPTSPMKTSEDTPIPSGSMSCLGPRFLLQEDRLSAPREGRCLASQGWRSKPQHGGPAPGCCSSQPAPSSNSRAAHAEFKVGLPSVVTRLSDTCQVPTLLSSTASRSTCPAHMRVHECVPLGTCAHTCTYEHVLTHTYVSNAYICIHIHTHMHT